MAVVVARNVYDAYVLPFPGAPGGGIDFKDSLSLTKQADLKDTDINLIMKRFEKTGQLPSMIAKQGSFGDFAEVPDFQAALNIVNAAEAQFMALEASVRSRFDNDPAKFLEFVHNPVNLEEMGDLGLLNEAGMAKLQAKQDLAASAQAEANAKRKAAEAAAPGGVVKPA